MSDTVSANKPYFSLTANQKTVFSAMTFQRSGPMPPTPACRSNDAVMLTALAAMHHRRTSNLPRVKRKKKVGDGESELWTPTAKG